MTIREKIQAKEALREAQRKEGDLLGKAIRKAFIWIFCGYAAGTVIGLLLRRLING